ncbi:hypothetical protein [Herbaspirillum rubrisubalbicans]|uniref:DUF4365 domain-containing protein n=2 Tax=Herbaspirillum rubrisubalbicans TaxID=80842 RepID=A0A6M4A1I5_9BURK|nr:hypothetical protein [Herbaspirillum rubrisubalbicans]NQE49921.1 hypothetical protein [Herbaspirillum rubrisubalbicans]QJQ03532.1 hypothetical protein C798_25830 [Herbaspirillum rubrisubalbicans Os34]
MGNFQNIIGAGGEFLCGIELMRPVVLCPEFNNGFPGTGLGYLFEALHFGGKEPTYDYLVYLLDANAQRRGPFFFLQVKTTLKTPTDGGTYGLRFTASDVARAKAMKTPFFIGIVDRTSKDNEKIYVKGIAATRSKGIFRLKPVHDLADDTVKIDLYNEVFRLWTLQNTPLLSRLL